MLNKLKKLLKNSYSPYSNIQVAAILIDLNNNEYKGINIENAAYSPSICAERSAIASAISLGVKPKSFKSIYLTSSMPKTTKLFSPCGVCLQVMIEMFDKDTDIYIYNGEEKHKFKIHDLVPYGFSLTNEDFKWK